MVKCRLATSYFGVVQGILDITLPNLDKSSYERVVGYIFKAFFLFGDYFPCNPVNEVLTCIYELYVKWLSSEISWAI